MNSMDSPRCACRRASSSRIWRWMVTSSAVVGSSAISSCGSQASAIAIITRCCWPPESWCGYVSSRRLGSGMPTSTSSSSVRARAAARPMNRCLRSGSAICSPMVSTGLSDDIGSWNTQAISCPRRRCMCARGACSRSSPRHSTRPEHSALRGSSCTSAIAVTLLPEPDSPTRATVVLAGTSKLMPASPRPTASTRRERPLASSRRNATCRFSTFRIALIAGPAASDRARRATRPPSARTP